jgi:hypothetical protein
VLPALGRRKLPDVGIERAERIPCLEEHLSVRNRGGYLEPVAHDPGVSQEARDIIRTVPGDDRGIEAIERPNERLALAQDRRPGESRLEPLEDQAFKKVAVVMTGNAPLLIVIGDHQRVVSSPLTTDQGGT